MNLVVGATGVLGGEICSRLAQAGESVRGLIRASSSPERVNALRKAGVELATGDLTDRASLDAVCRGVHLLPRKVGHRLPAAGGQARDR